MRFTSLVAVVILVATTGGCLEPPMSAYFLKNSTSEILSVYSRYNDNPKFRKRWEVKPGESDILAEYRGSAGKNFALDEGLELRLQSAECTADVSNKSLREKTQTKNETKWVFDVVPEMLVCPAPRAVSASPSR